MNLSAENNESCKSCEFDENLKILREIPFFSGLPLETLKVLAYLCTTETFKQGDYLFHQDDDDGQAFYFIQGKAELMRTGETEEERIREYAEGSFIGGLTLMGSLRRLFSLKALTDVTCLILTRDKFSRTMDQFPALMPKVIAAQITSIRSWEERFLMALDKNCPACKTKIGISLE
jgi:CRP/FNR family cyclic AMP-dependent transcriptional regulator